MGVGNHEKNGTLFHGSKGRLAPWVSKIHHLFGTVIAASPPGLSNSLYLAMLSSDLRCSITSKLIRRSKLPGRGCCSRSSWIKLDLLSLFFFFCSSYSFE